MSILIVDDSNTDIQIIKDMLAEAGYADVLTASSAAEAFSFFNLQDDTDAPPTEIELILMDIFMPGMDGLEACNHIKEIESLKDIPVIVVTAKASDENLSLAFKKGASDYIKKPINEIELLSRIKAALRLRQEINERKKAEESLRAFEKAIENLQIGVTDRLISCLRQRRQQRGDPKRYSGNHHNNHIQGVYLSLTPQPPLIAHSQIPSPLTIELRTIALT